LRCFVIMPFTVRDRKQYVDLNHWNEVYAGLIRPAVQTSGMSCDRDDEDRGGRLITEQIFEKIERADLVLCDLSGHNPNVALELGWALRADKPFVLIKDEKTTFFFDLNQYYTFEYSSSLQPSSLRTETDQLASVICSTVEDKVRRYSLVRRLSVSALAIRELNDKEDPLLTMIADVQQRVRQLGLPGRLAELESEQFPWPRLLRYGNSVLHQVSDLLERLPDGQDITDDVEALLASLGARMNPELQVSVIDEQKVFVYHCWENLVGTYAHYLAADGSNIFEDVLTFPSGAVAWIDRSTNVFRPNQPVSVRMNIGLFTSVRHGKWRAMVEAHHEIPGAQL